MYTYAPGSSSFSLPIVSVSRKNRGASFLASAESRSTAHIQPEHSPPCTPMPPPSATHAAASSRLTLFFSSCHLLSRGFLSSARRRIILKPASAYALRICLLSVILFTRNSVLFAGADLLDKGAPFAAGARFFYATRYFLLSVSLPSSRLYPRENRQMLARVRGTGAPRARRLKRAA